MTLAPTLAGVFAGTLFVACGWNKLFHPQRSHDMRETMRNLFGDELGRDIATFVASTQLLAGLLLAVSSLLDWGVLVALSGLVLLTICVAGYVLVAHDKMVQEWDPYGWVDRLACAMWTSEVMLATLILVAILGTI